MFLMCAEDIESLDHLFFLCKVAQKVWHMCENWVDISYVMHNNLFIISISFILFLWKGMWVGLI